MSREQSATCEFLPKGHPLLQLVERHEAALQRLHGRVRPVQRLALNLTGCPVIDLELLSDFRFALRSLSLAFRPICLHAPADGLAGGRAFPPI